MYDDEYDCDVCSINLDEDELIRFMSGSDFNCPYFKFYDEYKMVRKQNQYVNKTFTNIFSHN